LFWQNFYRPDTLPVTQPAALEHWRMRALLTGGSMLRPCCQDRQGRLSRQQPRRYSPNFTFYPPFPIPLFPYIPLFPSPSPSLASPPFPSYREAASWKQLGGLGERCKRSPSRHRFWCILRGKNSFDSNYYMDFCILKFIKLLIKSPKLSLVHLSPTVERIDRRPWRSVRGTVIAAWEESIPPVTITVFQTWRQHVATMLSWWARNTVVAGLFTCWMPFLSPNRRRQNTELDWRQR